MRSLVVIVLLFGLAGKFSGFYFQFENCLILGTLYAANHKSPNYRQDMDKFMFAFVEEHIAHSEEQLMTLQQKYDEYLAHKDANLKSEIQKTIKIQLPIIESTIATADEMLKTRTDFNEFEKYMTERMHDDLTLLIKHYKKLAEKVK